MRMAICKCVFDNLARCSNERSHWKRTALLSAFEVEKVEIRRRRSAGGAGWASVWQTRGFRVKTSGCLPRQLARPVIVVAPGCFEREGSSDIGWNFRASNDVTSTPRIAIVGAGAGGSFAAFWIAKAKERFGFDVEVDVYERESNVGGRSLSVHPYDDQSLPAIEIGAPVFSETDRNLWRASDEFNLTRVSPQHLRSGFAIWNGEKMILNWTANAGWWSGWLRTLKIIWTYGLAAPKRVDQIAKSIIEPFSSLYSPESRKWDNVANMAASLGLDVAAHTFSSYIRDNDPNVPEIYVNDLVHAATRLNYAQNADEIHALQGAFSLSSQGVSIQGGNSRLFEQLINYSAARILLNTTVKSINPKSAKSPLWTIQTSAGSADYKAVVIATPIHSSGISIPDAISSQVPKQPTDSLHVTVLTTKALAPNPEYFGLPASSSIPQRVLTTCNGKRYGGHEPEFFSLSYEGLVKEEEWAVKILSKQPISDEWLDNVFTNQVGWVHRKEWTSVPKSVPSTSFAPVRLAQGLYYVNAFEPLVSTMEMATVASRNVIDLLLHEEFASSICGPIVLDSEERQTPLTSATDPIIGWDC